MGSLHIERTQDGNEELVLLPKRPDKENARRIQTKSEDGGDKGVTETVSSRPSPSQHVEHSITPLSLVAYPDIDMLTGQVSP